MQSLLTPPSKSILKFVFKAFSIKNIKGATTYIVI